MGVITVRLEATRIGRKFPCLACGGRSNREPVLPFVYEDGEETGFVICEGCLCDANLASTMLDTAARRRDLVEPLAVLARDLSAVPSHAAWDAENRAEDRREAERRGVDYDAWVAWVALDAAVPVGGVS